MRLLATITIIFLLICCDNNKKVEEEEEQISVRKFKECLQECKRKTVTNIISLGFTQQQIAEIDISGICVEFCIVSLEKQKREEEEERSGRKHKRIRRSYRSDVKR